MKTATGAVPAIAGGQPAFAQRLPMVQPEGLPLDGFLEMVDAIVRSRMLTNASRVREFEEAAAAFLGVPHCVAVASCTSGLLLTLRALGLKGEVILPSFTFHVTAHALLWNGLKPVFADCDPETFCLSPDSVRDHLTPRTAAILPVHMYGHPAEVEALEAIAADRGLPVIYDAAHAFGSARRGRRVGGFGAAEIFSFSPTKLLVAGEGGLVSTRDAALAQKLRAGRNYGDPGTYDPEMLGLNARMSEFHAALARLALHGIEPRIARRNEIRRRYERLLGGLPGVRFQTIRPDCLSTCKDFSLLVDAREFGAPRDWLFQALQKENIDVRRYFWPPVHRQTLYRRYARRLSLPATDLVSDTVISLPIYSSLRDETVDRVCEAVAALQQFARENSPCAEASR